MREGWQRVRERGREREKMSVVVNRQSLFLLLSLIHPLTARFCTASCPSSPLHLSSCCWTAVGGSGKGERAREIESGRSLVPVDCVVGFTDSPLLSPMPFVAQCRCPLMRPLSLFVCSRWSCCFSQRLTVMEGTERVRVRENSGFQGSSASLCASRILSPLSLLLLAPVPSRRFRCPLSPCS